MKTIERFAALLECGTKRALHDQLIGLARHCGFDRYLIAAVPRNQSSFDDVFLLSSYPARWRNEYDRAKLAYIDPTVAHCLRRTVPLVWRPEIFASRKQQEMYEQSAHYGLRSGITLPWHGADGESGILCFVNDGRMDDRFVREAVNILPSLALMRDFAFESLPNLAQPLSDASWSPHLTRREIECLKWCAQGKSSWDISQILRCSEAVVNFHFNNLRKKFNTTSRRHAVVKAIRLGLIHP